MAFLDPLHGAPAIAAAGPAIPAPAGAATPAVTADGGGPSQLDPLARRVVALSRRDTVRSLARRSGPARWLARGAANRLADPRLEALRGYAVMLRHAGDEGAAPYADALVARGCTVAQVTHARWLVAREARAERGPRPISRLALGCALLLALWLGTLAGHAAADRVIGLVVGLLVAITLAPLAAVGGEPRRRRRRGVARA